MTTKNKVSKAKKEEKEIVVITQADVRAAVEANPTYKWFIIQTYSGKDAAAKRSIEERLITSGTEADMGVIIMAEKKVSELRGGKMKVVKKKLYPGYLYFLAKPLEGNDSFMDEDVYTAIRGSANLIGFIGQDNAKLPKCIRNKVEINRMISQLQDGDDVESAFSFEVGAEVTITTGHFEGLHGKISEVDIPKGTVKVDMEMLGTITPVDLPIDSVVMAQPSES